VPEAGAVAESFADRLTARGRTVRTFARWRDSHPTREHTRCVARPVITTTAPSAASAANAGPRSPRFARRVARRTDREKSSAGAAVDGFRPWRLRSALRRRLPSTTPRRRASAGSSRCSSAISSARRRSRSSSTPRTCGPPQTGQPFFDAALHRLDGDLLLATGGAADATADRYHRALTIAREQGARSLELRTAKSLARLLRDQGKRADARALLAPVFAWFTEGFDTRDLREAHALLGELR